MFSSVAEEVRRDDLDFEVKESTCKTEDTFFSLSVRYEYLLSLFKDVSEADLSDVLKNLKLYGYYQRSLSGCLNVFRFLIYKNKICIFLDL
ncbi:hypothetical protein XENOCAPTIV_002224 [Xenoophorus captivus]|uniref:Uncharacterized protein n=1 Tax=Xenoophorus captivus TaxID=1517983 RepID=A0ABV0S4N0_9TELE